MVAPSTEGHAVYVRMERRRVVIMNTMEVLTLLLVIFTALAYIDGHNKRK